MTDAVLSFDIDSTPAASAAADLDRMTAAAKKAEEQALKTVSATDAYGKAVERTVAPVTGASSSLSKMADAVRQQEAAERAAYQATRNLTQSVQDLNKVTSQADAHMVAWRRSTSGVATNLGDFTSHIDAWRRSTAGAVNNLGDFSSHVEVFRRTAAGAAGASAVNERAIKQLGGAIGDMAARAATGTTSLSNLASSGARAGTAFVSLLPALAPLLPLVGGIALGVVGIGSALAGVFALGTRAASKEIGDLTTGMNLTQAQMDQLKEKGVQTTVTMGDAWRGLGTTIKEVFGPQIQWVQEKWAALTGWLDRKWNEFLDATWKAVVGATKRIVGGFTGAFYAVRDTWKMIPSALGDAAISAANAVLRGVESMINGGVRLINKLIRAANAAADAIPGVDAFIPVLDEVSIARFVNPFEGAMSRAGHRAGASYAEGYAVGVAGLESFASRLVDNIEASGAARVRAALEDTEDAVAQTGRAMGAAATQAGRLREEIERIQQPRNRAALSDFNIELPRLIDPLVLVVEELRLIEQLGRQAGKGLEEAFGRVGGAVADLTNALNGYQAQLAEIDLAEKERRLSTEQAVRERAHLEVATYGDISRAAKGFFAEQTAAYKLLHAAEQAFRLYQFAMSAKAILFRGMETAATVTGAATEATAVAGAEATKTASTVAGTSVRTPLKAAEGAASMFAALGPFGFPAVAAMFAVLAGIGFSGGGGGASSYTPPTTNTGTGTTLGDPTASSESLTRSMETVQRYQDADLGLSRNMLSALRGIESNITALTTSIANQMGAGGAFDTAGLNLGSSTGGGFLGIGATTRTRELAGQGLDLTAGSLSQLIANGVQGSIYQLVTNTKTKSGFLGFGGGTTTWTTETRGPMDVALSRELGQILASLRTGVLAAAGQLGIEGATATLDSMVISLGRIDFSGLSSSEISQRLTQVFSAVGDQMAMALLPQIQQFQQAGEGLMETLIRLATQVQTVDGRLNAIGMSMTATGLAGIAARDRLVQLSGGLDEFLDQTEFFASNFLTDAQRLAPIQALVTAELTRLGLAADLTREQFAGTVLGLDLATEAGAAMFAALMQLAPAFDQVVSATEDAAARLAEEARRQVEAAARIADQRRGLEIALLDATGQTTAALEMRRAAELEALDESLRGLQLQVWAAQDAAAAQAELARQMEEASRAAEQYRQQLMQNVEDARGKLAQAYQREAAEIQGVIDRFDGFATSLRAFRDTLSDQMPGATSYEAQRAIFNRMAAQARQGDETALSGLQGAAEAYLQSARVNAASQEAYLFDLARVRRGVADGIIGADAQKSVAEQQLGQLKDQVRHLIDLNENVLSVHQAIVDLHRAMRAAGVTAFATGGVFTNGVVSTPTVAPMALFGEAGPEAIMPLARGPNGLGVRASNDNDRDREELQALREEIARLRAETRPFLQAIAANTGRSERSLDRMEMFGLNVRGQAPGDPVPVVVTEDAA